MHAGRLWLAEALLLSLSFSFQNASSELLEMEFWNLGCDFSMEKQLELSFQHGFRPYK